MESNIERLDRLSALIDQFRTKVEVISGNGSAKVELESNARANLFLTAFRWVDKEMLSGEGIELVETGDDDQCLIFIPDTLAVNGMPVIEDPNSDVVCIHVNIGGVEAPVAFALPHMIAINLKRVPDIESIGRILKDEINESRCGRNAVVDRLCEIMVIRLLRFVIESGEAKVGLLAGLAHQNICNALVAIHERPERNWTLEDLSELAGMSRTRFVNVFKEILGKTPAKYLSTWRMMLAKAEFEKGAPMKSVSRKVGFSSSASLSRAFRLHFGYPPVRPK